MRLEQMRPRDLKIWTPDDPHRFWLYGHMTDGVRQLWEQHYDPRYAMYGDNEDTGHDRRKWAFQLYLRDYLRCIASVDDSVGRLLDCLREQRLHDNTLVVYTSDQGFYLGEHGWFDKRFMYEQSLRTPLLVSGPGVKGGVSKQIVSDLDFAPTLLELAGVEVPEDMQGQSMTPLLAGKTPADWRTEFYYHYYEGPDRDHKVARHDGVTTGRYKLIHFYELDEWELFDLQSDPHELTSVYGDAEYREVQARMTAALQRLRRSLDVPGLSQQAPAAP